MVTATPPFAWFLLMNSLSVMRRVIITTTPALRPMRGHFCEFINENTAEFGIGADTSLLLINTVVLRVTFSSSEVSLKMCILWCSKWISFVWLVRRETDPQLILGDLMEHTRGNLMSAVEKNVHCDDTVLPLKGHVSVMVRLPSNVKWKFSKRALQVEDDVELIDLWMVQVLPITWMSWLIILVDWDKTASCERRMYVESFLYLY